MAPFARVSSGIRKVGAVETVCLNACTLECSLRSDISIKQDTSVLEVSRVRPKLKMFLETVLSILGGDGKDIGGIW